MFHGKSLLMLLAFFAFLGGAFYFVNFTDTGSELLQASFAFVRALDPIQARLAYVGIYIVGTVLLVPGTLISILGATLFGFFEGTLYTWIGATIGATLSFLLARLLGREFVDRLLGGRLQALDRRLRDHGFTGLLVLRLVPLFPFTGLNFGSGLTSIRLRDFILATAIGIIPGTAVFQFLFAVAAEKVSSEAFEWTDLWDWRLLTALGLFIVFALASRLLSRKLAKASEPEALATDGMSSRH